ncbi:MAG: hypothetical protein PHQ86_08415, partial [Dehalococcoidales bacterium]|nr:hypothetical protein [Dehalococcoidales bacterium]
GRLSWRSDPQPPAVLGWKENTPYPFKGSISTVRTYSRALSDSEVRDNLYTETNVPTNGLKAFWKLNNGSDIITDSSGNGYTATFVNSGGAAGWIDDGPIPYDPASATDYGYNLFGFDKDTLTNCIDDNLLGGIYNCFISSTRNSNVKVMSSRTYVNRDPATAITELAALYYSPKSTLAGDAYLGNMDSSNFSYWGRNLVQGTGSSSNESFWGVGNYSLNPDAQASLNVNGAEYKQYKAKIDTLTGEAIASGSVANSDLNLQRSNITSAASTDESADYPGGKIWKIADYTNNYHCGDGTLPGSCAITYHGKGTIILPKAFIAAYGSDSQMYIYKDIKPAAGDSNARLGYITDRNVNISDNVTVQATIFTTGTITIGNNVTMIGSFVASNFNITGNNVRFLYDKGLSTSQPPGFGYLKMPHSSEN